jgi:hypothetical protein
MTSVDRYNLARIFNEKTVCQKSVFIFGVRLMFPVVFVVDLVACSCWDFIFVLAVALLACSLGATSFSLPLALHGSAWLSHFQFCPRGGFRCWPDFPSCSRLISRSQGFRVRFLLFLPCRFSSRVRARSGPRFSVRWFASLFYSFPLIFFGRVVDLLCSCVFGAKILVSRELLGVRSLVVLCLFIACFSSLLARDFSCLQFSYAVGFQFLVASAPEQRIRCSIFRPAPQSPSSYWPIRHTGWFPLLVAAILLVGRWSDPSES